MGPRQMDLDFGWSAGVWFTTPTFDDFVQISLALLSGRCVAVSDGSALENIAGTAAWCVSAGNLMEIISAGFRVPGPGFSQCSYRSELAGVHAKIKVIHRVVRFFEIREGSIEVGTDSESVINRLFCSLQPACLADHSFDLLAECQQLMSEIPQI